MATGGRSPPEISRRESSQLDDHRGRGQSARAAVPIRTGRQARRGGRHHGGNGGSSGEGGFGQARALHRGSTHQARGGYGSGLSAVRRGQNGSGGRPKRPSLKIGSQETRSGD